jgi:hypothetical protein
LAKKRDPQQTRAKKLENAGDWIGRFALAFGRAVALHRKSTAAGLESTAKPPQEAVGRARASAMDVAPDRM